MEIKEENILKLTINYSNSSTERRKVLDYLDRKYGTLNYSVKRAGPINLDNIADGLMVVEVYNQ